MTGQQRADISIPRSSKQALSIKSCEDLLRIQNDEDLRQIWFYDGKSGKQLSRSKEHLALSYLGTVLHDRINDNTGIYRENIDYDHLCWRESAVICTAIAPHERNEGYEVGQPIYLQGNYVGYTGNLRYQPQLFLWLGKYWKWFERWVYERWPYSMSCLYFYDRTTGKMVWKIPRAMESKLVCESSHHFYTRCFYNNRLIINGRLTERGESTLECWAIPFKFYSAWWSRGAGLLVFVAVLMLRRKKQSALAL